MASKRGRLNDGAKQRIVGALVLAALAVIFLPSLFDREGTRYIDVTSQIPPPPDIRPIEIAEPQPVADIVAAPAAEDAFQPPLVEQPSSSKPSGENSVVLSGDQKGGNSAPDQAVPENNSSPILDDQGLPIAWVVQVASYREEARANRMRLQLMDEGYKAYTRAVTTGKGRFVRVFVGPKGSKADAQVAKRELDHLLNTQTLVLRFQP